MPVTWNSASATNPASLPRAKRAASCGERNCRLRTPPRKSATVAFSATRDHVSRLTVNRAPSTSVHRRRTVSASPPAAGADGGGASTGTGVGAGEPGSPPVVGAGGSAVGRASGAGEPGVRAAGQPPPVVAGSGVGAGSVGVGVGAGAGAGAGVAAGAGAGAAELTAAGTPPAAEMRRSNRSSRVPRPPSVSAPGSSRRAQSSSSCSRGDVAPVICSSPAATTSAARDSSLRPGGRPAPAAVRGRPRGRPGRPRPRHPRRRR